MPCSNCGSENRPEARFCRLCGAGLVARCPNGHEVAPGDRFCDRCGASTENPGSVIEVAQLADTGVAVQPATATERRLVSVLFADLVGFTTLAESRDSEEVRDLLSRYFDACRTVITRYGGTVEKFIGDAVMAVWGTPVANEDDAERTVRSALDLVEAVSALGAEVGAPELTARAGVLTGEVTVNVGATGEGMVAGDPVNTASRIQSVAVPGSVFVGESTRRASEAAIAYEDAGSHELKGKAEPIRLWRALRVTAGRGGLMKSEGLEPPFVGRDRELKLVKELFHACVDEGRTTLIQVTGIAGIGKSRLAWEFFKYMDGLRGVFQWHRGRCPAYGEGVTYWALAEMVRGRAGIVEGEDRASASAKLREAVERYVSDPEDRRFVEPRLAHLIGLEDRTAPDKTDLFSGWRLFFERLATQRPVLMLFEDLQWADPSLLEFLDYLLEWSRNFPIFLMTVARPGADGGSLLAAKRNATSIYLEPLPAPAMEHLLTGLVPGLPRELTAKILDRAEGVPLYAVETVRMLLDRGLLVEDGPVYRVTGSIEDLEIPETLHALIAARLDGLSPEERRLVQDASVLGRTFTRAAAAALSGQDERRLEPLLASLLVKEVLSIQADPRSPERGQYGFLQDLVRRVAYETLSRKERRTKHLRIASYLEAGSGHDEDEIVEVVASHYQEAYRAAPDAPDAAEIKDRARDMLVRAGERAASLAANEEAQRYYEQAAELTDDTVEQATLLERAGVMAAIGGRTEDATTRYEQAIALFEEEGQSHPAARVSARLGVVEHQQGQLDQAIERMQSAFAVLAGETPDPDLASLAAELGRLLYFAGHADSAIEPIEVAVDLSESFWLPEILSNALNTKGLLALAKGRRREAQGLIKYALELALENDATAAALRAYYNLAEIVAHGDRYEEGRGYAADGLAFARRAGNRFWEWSFLSQVYPLFCLGQWDEALALMADLPRENFSQIRAAFLGFAHVAPGIAVYRGELDEARAALDLCAELGDSSDIQEASVYAAGRAVLLSAEGRFDEALVAAETALRGREALSLGHEAVKESFVEAIDAAFALADLDKVQELLEIVEGVAPGKRPPLMEAQVLRTRARLAATRGDKQEVEAGFKEASGLFRELSLPFWMGVTLLEHGEWLTAQDRPERAEPLLLEARQVFERLKAQPWLDRLARIPRNARVPEAAEPGT
jgi:class 3 adenylate cyclase/tetratricopeptide (TPR) repeat protein